MRKVCIVGADGQDGSYLTDHLLLNGDFVIGIGRRLKSLESTLRKNFVYRTVDLTELFFSAKNCPSRAQS